MSLKPSTLLLLGFFQKYSTPRSFLTVSKGDSIGWMFSLSLSSDGPVGPTAPWKPVAP